MNTPSSYPPSETINFPALLYAGTGERISQTLVNLAANQTLVIPQGAIFYSIGLSQTSATPATPSSCTISVDGTTTQTLTAPTSITGFGPIMDPITITATTVGVSVLYGINNTINNTIGLG